MLSNKEKELVLLYKILEELRNLNCKIDRLSTFPIKLEIKFNNEEIGMDVSVQVSPTAKVHGTVVETNLDGSVFTYDPTKIQWAVEDGSIISFTQNPDGSADFTPLKAGSTSVAANDSATGLSATANITVTEVTPPSGPTKLEITFEVTP